VVDLPQIEKTVSLRLAKWAIGSIVLGTAMLLTPWPLIEGFGLQTLVWGAIDAGIAGVGLRRARRRFRAVPEEHRTVRDALRLRRLLIINGRLDIVYIAIGVAGTIVFRDDRFLAGNGFGIIAQSVFLLVFDFGHARLLPAHAPPWYDAER
jgi:hypothetical protein